MISPCQVLAGAFFVQAIMSKHVNSLRDGERLAGLDVVAGGVGKCGVGHVRHLRSIGPGPFRRETKSHRVVTAGGRRAGGSTTRSRHLEADSSAGDRAIACIQKLQELNNAVTISTVITELTKEQLSDFQVC